MKCWCASGPILAGSVARRTSVSQLALGAYLSKAAVISRQVPDQIQIPLTSQPTPDQMLTMSLCAPLVGVPRAHFSHPQIKLSAAFLTCETTKKACLSPYWGNVFELESGPAAGLACCGYGLLLTTTCMSYPVNSVMHFQAAVAMIHSPP